MHIEPGILSGAKIAAANLAATALAAAQAPQLFKKPQLILRTLLAALFLSVFMQSFHMPAGVSELHFIGAMPIYLALGFAPGGRGSQAHVPARGAAELRPSADRRGAGLHVAAAGRPAILHRPARRRGEKTWLSVST